MLDKHGIHSSLFYMGEYVDSPDLVETNVRNKLLIADRLGEGGLDVHISVDPTQIGHVIDPSIVAGHARRIAEGVSRNAADRAGVHCLMLDMEDFSLTDPTIALHDRLQDDGLPVALTLQAYLKRSFDDVEAQIRRGGIVRLVKGAFVAGPDIAYVRQSDIKANFRRIIERMLSRQARDNGFFPVVATHDTRLHDLACDLADRNGWQADEYEVEMLFGVRGDVAEALARRGRRVRLYVPFGEDWWPYAVRRIGENPRNAILLARSLIS